MPVSSPRTETPSNERTHWKICQAGFPAKLRRRRKADKQYVVSETLAGCEITYVLLAPSLLLQAWSDFSPWNFFRGPITVKGFSPFCLAKVCTFRFDFPFRAFGPCGQRVGSRLFLCFHLNFLSPLLSHFSSLPRSNEDSHR